ncbi:MULTISPECIES: serine hydrolase domain-containing protein [unclassified Streptomyces]|uniref:serine hydrolase domain-containing protein n=1 Tax=unclassified Streptomyces TaxID=2593676 RepID=UPI002E7600C3|nr:serine hydrolase domain-containing protein [Streptomyces sp. JV184]MEE1744130.1 serine hydrolase [Streptomyces sp. JV184]
MRILRITGTVIATTLLLTAAAPVASAGARPSAAAASAPSSPPREALDPAALGSSLLAVHEAGMYGVYSSVRDGAQSWTGASGVADVDTGRPVKPGMRQRVGSISKTFAAVAVLQQVERGRIRLNAPIGDYLPDLIPGQRGRQITVRMLLNHTSGIGDYITGAFPSLARGSTASLDEERFRFVSPQELVRLGLTAPATGTPGAQPGHYSNTNYIIAGLLLAKVTGQNPETYITQHVIDRAGLHHTSYPSSPDIQGPHARMYENFYGLIDPPRDYSVYDMSWAYTAGAVVSTTGDLNRFYRALLTGRLIGTAALKEMQRTVSVNGMDYGLGLYAVDIPGCGRFWGHDGAVFGAGTIALASPDGRRQVAAGWNLMKYQRIDADGTGFEPSPIDDALNRYVIGALCPAYAAAPAAALSAAPTPTVLTGADLSPEPWAAVLR